MKLFSTLITVAITGLASLQLLAATNTATVWPGLQPDGSMLLHNNWSLRPAGKSIGLANFPVNLAVSPNGHYAAVLHCGYATHRVLIVDLRSQKISDEADLNEAFYGITFSADGRMLYCSGASDEVVHAFHFDQGKLSPDNAIRLRPREETGVPAGVAVDPAGKTLYVANLWSSRISQVTLADGSVEDIVLSSNAAPVMIAQPQPLENFATTAAKKRNRAVRTAEAAKDNVYPYGCVLDSKHHRLYVSLWGESAVAVVDLATGQMTARWPVGEHPCEMTLTKDGNTLFVANANDNTVTVLDTTTGHATETLWDTLFPNSPPGATPNSLALSPDEKYLFVANANINAVGVFDITEPAHGRCLGFIPTGWYPTSVRLTPDGQRLLIVSGKGNTALSNAGNVHVAGQPKKKTSQYIAGLYKGTLNIIDLPAPSAFAQQIAAWTADVLKCTPLRADASAVGIRPENNPIPGKPGDPSPITHCIYIIKENRTYDQVLGDVTNGNGDANLCLFPQRVTPNIHALVHDFVLLDNFYADAEVSASGHEWSMGAYCSDFVEKTWPIEYGHKNTKFPYPAEGLFTIASPASGYLWDRAKEAGVSYRSYGEFVQTPANSDISKTHVKTLEGHFDPLFHSFNLDYSDAKRAARFISEMKRFESEGDMPRLQIVRLPNDHTYGVTKGKRTPTAYVAENDAALGQVVDAVTHSKFWTNTAIFIVEDDAQDGPDHVDAHRTEALVVSPYTRRGAVDSTLYSTSSMLRTIELILGLQPMSQFDAAATPMYQSFQPQADLTPYTALPPQVDVTALNNPLAWGSQEKFVFTKEDANDDIKFNEVIWRSVCGADHPMPAPVHAGFILAGRDTDDDDD